MAAVAVAVTVAVVVASVSAVAEVFLALVDGDFFRDHNLAATLSAENELLGNDGLFEDALAVLLAALASVEFAFDELVATLVTSALGSPSLDDGDGLDLAADDSALGTLAAGQSPLDDLDKLALDDSVSALGALALSNPALDGDDLLDADALNHTAFFAGPLDAVFPNGNFLLHSYYTV